MPSYLEFIQPSYKIKINHLRALGAIWIFAFHYYHFITHSFFTPLNSINPFELLIYHGYFFVYLFFILSGFLLTRAYKDKLDIILFFTKRVGSIFPAYYLCILVYCFLFTNSLPDLKLLVSIFSFDLGVYPGAIGHLWFVNRLLECYLCFPLLWWILKKARRTGLAMIYLFCLMGGGYWVIHSQVTLPDYYFSFVLCLSNFILGMLMAGVAIKPNHSRYIASTLIIFIIIMEWLHQSIWQAPLGYSWISVLWLNFIAVLFVVLIRAYLFLPIYLPKIISLMMKKLGDISYSFYLYYFLVIHFFIQHRELLSAYSGLNFTALFIICIIAAVFFQQLLTLFTSRVLLFKQIITHRLG